MTAASTFRRRMASETALDGVVLPSADPALIELCACIGVDFAILDCERHLVDDTSIANAVRAADAAKLPLVARFSGEWLRVMRFLDAGGAGIVIPHVSRIDHVEAALDAIHFPPVGTRGVGASRQFGHGMAAGDAAALEQAADAVWLCIQVEDVPGLGQLEGLLDIDRIDAVMVGTRDLAASLGLPGKLDAPPVRAAVDAVARSCADAGKIHVRVLRGRRAEREGGVTVVALSALLAEGWTQLGRRRGGQGDRPRAHRLPAEEAARR